MYTSIQVAIIMHWTLKLQNFVATIVVLSYTLCAPPIHRSKHTIVSIRLIWSYIRIYSFVPKLL